MTKNNPTLRFKKDDGTDYPDWMTMGLGDLGNTYTGLSGKTKVDFGAGKPFITYMNVYKNTITDVDGVNYVALKDGEKQNKVCKGDVLFTTSSETPDEIGMSSYVDFDINEYYLNSFCFGFRPFKDSTKFLGYYFRSPIFRQKIEPLAQGATRYNLSKTSFLNLQISLPCLEEQQKIADCLSALDELIEAEISQLANYQEYKQGLLQKLFPQAGAKTPELRFPGFSGDWATMLLSEISTPIKKKAEKGVPHQVLTLSSEQGIISQDDYFGRQIASKDTERYIEVQENDFIYNDRITKESEYGTMRRLSKYNKGIVSPIYKCFRFNKGEKPSFWEYYFSTSLHDDEYKNIANEGARSGRYNISVDKLLSSSVIFPTIEEQQKIADCLSTLDELIDSQQQQVDNLKEYKKGLMQELFPKGDK